MKTFIAKNKMYVIIFSVLIVAFFMIAFPKRSYAVTLSPDPGGTIPASVRQTLITCSQVNSPALTRWVSLAGNPAATSISNVPKGTTSLALQMNSAVAVCLPNSAVIENRLQIATASVTAGSITGAVGDVLVTNFGIGYTTPGIFRMTSSPFTYNFPAGGASSATPSINLSMNVKIMNYFPTVNWYLCSPAPATHQFGWQYQNCDNVPASFSIGVDVNSPPTGTISASCSLVSGAATVALSITTSDPDGDAVTVTSLTVAGGSHTTTARSIVVGFSTSGTASAVIDDGVNNGVTITSGSFTCPAQNKPPSGTITASCSMKASPLASTVLVPTVDLVITTSDPEGDAVSVTYLAVAGSSHTTTARSIVVGYGTSGIASANISDGVNADVTIDSGNFTCPSAPTCTISNITNLAGSAYIGKGDQIKFNVAITNAQGYRLGVNGPGYGSEYGSTDITNFLVASGSVYARASAALPSDNESFTVTNIADNDNTPTPYTIPMTVPSTLQNSVAFNWGLVKPGFAWLPITCSGGIFNVVQAFEHKPVVSSPLLNDSEAPTLATFHSVINNTYGTAMNVSSTRSYFKVVRPPAITYNKSSGTITGGTTTVINPVAGVQTTVMTTALTTDLGSINSASSLSPIVPGDFVCEKLTVNPSTGYIDVNNNIIGGTSAENTQCSGPKSIPYVRMYGNDVLAGVSLDSKNCTAVGDASVTGFTKLVGTNYVGTGAQLGVFSGGAGTIVKFASNILSEPANPSARTFANTIASGDTFGGQFGGSFCAENIWGTKGGTVTKNTGLIPASSSLGTYWGIGQYWYNSNDIGDGITSSTVNKQTAIYVDGDVTIKNNIVFGSTSWAALTDIPSFYLIVKGNIFVASNVTQLDGIYVALPRDTALTTPSTANNEGGRIFTCSDITSPTSKYDPSESYISGSCNNQLVINGSFIAKHVNFLRSKGTLANAGAAEKANSGTIAEVFNFSPEAYLAKPAINARPSAGVFDSVISLPPSL